MNITNTGWYLFSNTRSNTWNDMKLAEGFATCSVYQYIYNLNGSPIAPNTSLSIGNWTSIDVSGNNPSLTVGTAYWVNITNIPTSSFNINGTSATFSGIGTINSTSIVQMIQSSGYNQTEIQPVTSLRFYGFNTIGQTGLSIYSDDDVSQHFPNLNTISIAASVKTLGNNAFSIPNNSSASVLNVKNLIFEPNCQLTSIGENALSSMLYLESFSIPSSVTTLGVNALANVGAGNGSISLNTIISDNLTSIGGGAFAQMQTNTFTLYPSNPNYSIIGPVLFNKDQTTLVQYAFGSNTSTTYTIPNTVTTIGAYSFNAMALNNIIIPNSVTAIENNAFDNAYLNTSVNIPASVTFIGEYAFKQTLNLPSFNVDINNPSYLSDGGVLFDKNKTTLIQYPCSRNSSSYTMPSNVTSIKPYAFANVSSNSSLNGVSVLTNVILPENNSYLYIGDFAFASTEIDTCEFSNTVITDIGKYAFYGTKLTFVSFRPNISSIGDYAFSGTNSITSVTFPSYPLIRYIGPNAFQGNITLTISSSMITASINQKSTGIYTGSIPQLYTDLGTPIPAGNNIDLTGKSRDFFGANVITLNITTP